MKPALTLLLLIGLNSVVAHAQSPKPDYSGTWVLNLQKSQLEDMDKSFTGSRFIIEQQGNKITLTRYHFYGEKKNRIRFHMKADGKTRKVKILFKGKLEWQEQELLSTLWRKNFNNVVRYRFGSSADEFIADEVFKGLPKDHHNIWVFDRLKP